MFRLPAKQFLGIALILLILSVGTYIIIHENTPPVPVPVKNVETIPPVQKLKSKIIGTSVEGRSIEVHTYGTGATHVTFVGGIHGGYEWNSVLLAYTFMDYLDTHPEFIPKNITVDVIPSANPDGVYKVTEKEGRFTAEDVSTDTKILASGRFNAHEVDLNRNFDCKWKPKSTWQSKTVSAGTSSFSEPEAQAIKNYITNTNPKVVVFWHSKSNAVYASQCEKGILPETLNVMNAYSQVSGYPPVKIFDAYATTGAADDWLASINIPAITVELKTHENIEWEKNIAGLIALIGLYKK